MQQNTPHYYTAFCGVCQVFWRNLLIFDIFLVFATAFARSPRRSRAWSLSFSISACPNTASGVLLPSSAFASGASVPPPSRFTGGGQGGRYLFADTKLRGYREYLCVPTKLPLHSRRRHYTKCAEISLCKSASLSGKEEELRAALVGQAPAKDSFRPCLLINSAYGNRADLSVWVNTGCEPFVRTLSKL